MEEAEVIGLRIQQEFEWIETAKSLLPVRAVFIGLVLAQVRASLDRGQWLPWVKKHCRGKQSTAYKYIAAARRCAAEARILLPELVAARQLQLDIDHGRPHDDGAKVLRKIKRWVGARSLQDLLADCETAPALGGARNKPARPVVDLDSLKARVRDDLAGLIERNRRLLLEENVLQYLEPAEVRNIVQSYADLAADLRQAAKSLLKEAAAS